MIDDSALSRELTAAIRATAGVAGVYPAQPIVEAAAGAVAVRLALRHPDVLVDIDRAEDFTTISAHIAVEASTSATETLRRVGELVRERVRDTGPLAINVKVRLVDDAGRDPVATTSS